MLNLCKLLILDYGGVYSFDYDSGNFNKIIVDTFGKMPSENERLQIIERSHLLGANKISTQEYVSMLSKILDVSQPPTVEKFEDATIAVTNPPSQQMSELVQEVRRNGLKVSLLSDMYMFEVKRTTPWGRYEGFDYVSFSAVVGMTKYDPRFFEQTLSHFGITAKESLFVDDVINNIEVAQSVGLNTLFVDKEKYLRVEQLVQQIYNLLGAE